jgi:hydroxymethylbilane synthase
MLPAPGQGALAVTARADASAAIAAVRTAVHHEPSAVAVSAERGFLRRLEGGCQVPVAAYASVDSKGFLQLHGRVISLGGGRMIEGREERIVRSVEEAEQLGSSLADRLLGEGAADILAEVRTGAVPAVPEP